MKLQPYLNYGGNCAEAFRFYEEHLGGKINFMMTFAQMPEPKQIPPGMENGVLHVSMILGETVVMASDVQPERFQPMRSAYLSLSVDSDQEAERIYKLFEEGGEIFTPIQETFFATRFAMLRDKFGTSWMVVHNRPMPS
ncbi:VOC family protein [Terracidiphilus gabretensis]|uniref:VOC family protein n=1 Tax=Terracidiphilus gabretensis TaxID=1577687 RepID=UPI00071BC18A|nr:VOC family protein [Terracidiphilus gabretensis]